jgi:hypothetical protein
MDEVEVDPEHTRRAGILQDDVFVPDLLDQGSGVRGDGAHLRAAG